MKTKIGASFIVIGAILMVAALSLLLFNEHQQSEAGKAVELVMPRIADAIKENSELRAESTDVIYEEVYETIMAATKDEPKEMPVVEIDGKSYVGVVSMESLQFELPVIADWSYDDLDKAPCLYSGSVYSDDMVIMAHNYTKHFGKISNLKVGETVCFVDANGKTVSYEVIAIDVLPETDIEEMTSGEYDLSLFTCDYSSRNRITVRCDRIN